MGHMMPPGDERRHSNRRAAKVPGPPNAGLRGAIGRVRGCSAEENRFPKGQKACHRSDRISRRCLWCWIHARGPSFGPPDRTGGAPVRIPIRGARSGPWRDAQRPQASFQRASSAGPAACPQDRAAGETTSDSGVQRGCRGLGGRFETFRRSVRSVCRDAGAAGPQGAWLLIRCGGNEARIRDHRNHNPARWMTR